MASEALLPGYLIVGTDEVKRSKAIRRMKARLEASGMVDFNFDEREMNREQDPNDVIASLNMLPMGADFRLVILRGCDRLPKAMSEPLVTYFASPAPDTICLVVADSLAKNTRLYKAIAKLGKNAIIDCASKKRWELPPQVQKMATDFGKTITLAAAEELVSRVGESTRMLNNELKKLAAMVEDPEIDREDVEALVVRTAEVKPWDFLDAMSARDAARALELYRLLPARSEVRLLTLMVGRLRELITAKSLSARGQARELATVLGVQAWQVKHHASWARAYSMEELIDALRAAEDVELALKGSRDSEAAFTNWIARITGESEGRSPALGARPADARQGVASPRPRRF